jgi:hypothetical protein
LLQAAKTVAEGGDPPGLDGICYRVRAIEKTLPGEVKWRDERWLHEIGQQAKCSSATMGD